MGGRAFIGDTPPHWLGFMIPVSLTRRQHCLAGFFMSLFKTKVVQISNSFLSRQIQDRIELRLEICNRHAICAKTNPAFAIYDFKSLRRVNCKMQMRSRGIASRATVTQKIARRNYVSFVYFY